MAYRSAYLALATALVVTGAVPATTAGAVPVSQPASLAASGTTPQAGSAPTSPAPVQLLPLTSSAGTATDLAQAAPAASGTAETAQSGEQAAGTTAGTAVRPTLAEAVAALTQVDPERDASLLTEPMEVGDFVVAGFTWQGAQDLPTGTRIYVRMRQDGQWSPWYLSEAAQDGPDDGHGVPGTEEVITGGADAVQAAVVTESALPADLTLALVPSAPAGEETLTSADVTETEAPATAVDSTADVPVPAETGDETADGADAGAEPGTSQVAQAPAGTASGQSVQPAAASLLAAATTANRLPVAVHTRSEWGAGGHGAWGLEYATADHVIVHHTAGGNDYTAAQSAGIVKGIYHYHATTLEWGDIGYNFLVDKYGQVFEGRDGTLASAPGKMVVAGHAYGVNTGTMGISMMGNYSTVAPPQAQLESVGKIAGWFLARGGHGNVTESAGLKIGATTKYKAGQTVSMPRIIGHRDVNYTECPGNVGYTYLGRIREIAAAQAGGSGGQSQGTTSSSSGWVLRNGTWYLNDSSGRHLTGWQRAGGAWYYLDPASGAMRTGWLNLGGTWYYLAGSGAMATGWVAVGGQWYYMSSSGAMRTGWLNLSGTWYYLTGSGAMATGWVAVGSQWYFMAGSGAMATGWVSTGGHWYYMSPSGAMRTGWLQLGSTWYYLDPSGAMATGARTVDGVTYYFTASGALGEGWSRSGQDWYYIGSDGVPVTGWKLLGSTWYYLKPDRVMAVGWRMVNGRWYYFNASGAMVTGWVWIGGAWYYMDSSGAMATGWLHQGNRWYYLASSGAMQTGWLKLGQTWYHFDEQGVMASGIDFFDGQYQVFNESGAWQYASTTKPAAASLHQVMSAPTASRASLVSSMVRAYQRSGATYPTAQLASGGARTIGDFAGIVYDEAVAEGVSPELVFVQAMKETGWLRFGGAVSISQFNFAGMGATGGGVSGASFKDVRTGIRAQVQHLRAYADSSVTAAKLKYAVVDPRFSYVRKGAAPYVEYLGIQENPQHTGWASAPGYGTSLAQLMETYF